MPEDAVGDAKSERGGLDEAEFELTLELSVHLYDAAGEPPDEFMHVVSLQPDATAREPVQRRSCTRELAKNSTTEERRTRRRTSTRPAGGAGPDVRSRDRNREPVQRLVMARDSDLSAGHRRVAAPRRRSVCLCELDGSALIVEFVSSCPPFLRGSELVLSAYSANSAFSVVPDAARSPARCSRPSQTRFRSSPRHSR
jgi:hypothetical protein